MDGGHAYGQDGNGMMAIVRLIAPLQSARGFTLIEVMMVIAILALLSTFAIPKYQGYVEKARIARCVAEIRYLERDIQAYYVATERYPTSLAELGLSISNMLDPWGNPYQYLLLAAQQQPSNSNGGTSWNYAGGWWRPGMVAAAVERVRGFWAGSWLVSEAWAAPPGGQSPGGGGGQGQGQGGGGGSQSGGGGGPGQGGNLAKARKDRFLVPINSDYDLYSMGAGRRKHAALDRCEKPRRHHPRCERRLRRHSRGILKGPD